MQQRLRKTGEEVTDDFVYDLRYTHCQLSLLLPASETGKSFLYPNAVNLQGGPNKRGQCVWLLASLKTPESISTSFGTLRHCSALITTTDAFQSLLLHKMATTTEEEQNPFFPSLKVNLKISGHNYFGSPGIKVQWHPLCRTAGYQRILQFFY